LKLRADGSRWIFDGAKLETILPTRSSIELERVGRMVNKMKK
jgi:hypothetical protein